MRTNPRGKMYERSRPGQTEEDLLRLQEEFYRDKLEHNIQVAATVVSTHHKPNPSGEETPGTSAEETQETYVVKDPPKYEDLGNIENIYLDRPPAFKFKIPDSSNIPHASRRERAKAEDPNSVFSHRTRKHGVVNMPMSSKSTEWTNVEQKKRNIVIKDPGPGCIIGNHDKECIRKENRDIMNQMSVDDIMFERNEILNNIDPVNLSFLKSRISNPGAPVENRAFDPEHDQWYDFEGLETTKLDWVKNTVKPKNKKIYVSEMRFDFEGWLLPFTCVNASASNPEFYYRGEKPNLTLQQVLLLCRSSDEQTKIDSLLRIARILSIQACGIYDNVIVLPMEQIIFTLFFSLEDKIDDVVFVTLKAIRNLLFHPIDETCLDYLWSFGMGIIQPILAIDNEGKFDDSTYCNKTLSEIDLVKCFMRSDIVNIISYILSTAKPSLPVVNYCLQILTRLARDSNSAIKVVYECDDLLQNVVTKFAPDITNTKNLIKAYGHSVLHALKFLRVLSARSRTIAIELINKYKVLDSLLSYLLNKVFSINPSGMKLQIEAFRLWTSFVRYGLTLQRFKEFHHGLWPHLVYHLKNTDLSSSYTSQVHLSALLILISEVVKHDFSATAVYYNLLFDLGITKWLTQFVTMKEFTRDKMQIVSSLLVALSSYIKSKPIEGGESMELLFKIVEKMMDSIAYQIVTEDIIACSNLLNNIETHNFGDNFNYTDALAWSSKDHVVPVLRLNSCFPFLRAFADFVEVTDNKELMIKFLFNVDLTCYLKQVQRANKYFLTNNWYTKVESSFLISVLKMSIEVQEKIDTEIYYEIAMKTLSIYSEDQKPDIEMLIKNAVFSPQFYPPAVLLKKRCTKDAGSIKLTTNIEDIYYVYMRVLGLKKLKVNPLRQSLEVKIGNAIPIDWIYSPIVSVYANMQVRPEKITEDDRMFTITNCLRWVYIYETYFPGLAHLIDATDSFCQLACTYLCSDSLFLLQDVNNLLKINLKFVLKSSYKLNFDKDIRIPFLNDFEVFFKKLLRQYQAVSYRDTLFGNFILVPLVQKHNSKFRKILWSEYPGVVQVFKVTERDIILPIELFLVQEEQDFSLVCCYQNALTSNKLKPTSVFYRIAKHHLERYIDKQQGMKK